jgi:hypothetical protein
MAHKMNERGALIAAQALYRKMQWLVRQEAWPPDPKSSTAIAYCYGQLRDELDSLFQVGEFLFSKKSIKK